MHKIEGFQVAIVGLLSNQRLDQTSAGMLEVLIVGGDDYQDFD